MNEIVWFDFISVCQWPSDQSSATFQTKRISRLIIIKDLTDLQIEDYTSRCRLFCGLSIWLENKINVSDIKQAGRYLSSTQGSMYLMRNISSNLSRSGTCFGQWLCKGII